MVCSVSWPLNGSVGSFSLCHGWQLGPGPGGEAASSVLGCLLSLASVLGPYLRLSRASSLGREPNPSEESVAQWRAHLGAQSGLHREARSSVHSWLCSWQEWLGAGAGMTLQSVGLLALWPLSRWERSPLPRLLHPIPPCLTHSWEHGSLQRATPEEAGEPWRADMPCSLYCPGNVN